MNIILFYKRNLLFRNLLFVILVFGIYIISVLCSWQILRILSGLFILSLLPGYYLNEIVGINKKLNKISLFGFAIISSLAIINFTLNIVSTKIGFTQWSFIMSVLTINLILFCFYYLSLIRRKKNSQDNSNLKINWYYYLIILLPVFLFFIRCIINPYLTDSDGAGYIEIMKEIEKTGKDTSYLVPIRAGFSYIVMAYRFVTGISFITLFKFILPSIAWLSFLSMGVMLSEKYKERFSLIASLLFLISPSLIGQIDRFKPETITFILYLPIIALYFFTIINKNYYFYLLGLLYCFVGLRIHDTGIMLFLIYLVSGVVLYKNQYLKQAKSFNLTIMLLFFILFIIPYLIIFDIKSIFLIPYHWYHSFSSSISFKLSLWFLDNYRSGNASLGWPGWRFILFYLFNGFFIVSLLIVIYIKSFYDNRNLKIIKTWLTNLLPAVLLFVIYLSVSEILPRFGIFVLPDRAWNHLFLISAISINFIYIIYLSKKDSLFNFLNNKIVFYLLFINLLFSIVASTVIAYSAGTVASRSETKTIKILNEALPKNSIILSTQKFNDIMVEQYTDKEFISIKFPETSDDPPLSSEQFNNSILENIKNKQIQRNSKYLIIEKTKLIEEKETFNNNYIFRNRQKQEISDEEKTINPEDLIVPENRPIYFIYSFAKTNGLMSKFNREYWVSGIDLNHKEFFNNFNQNIIYKDGSAILIKIR